MGEALPKSLDVITVGNATRGWGPIERLSTLAAEVFSAQLITVPARKSVSRLFWAKAGVPRNKGKDSGKSALLIVGVPGQLFALLEDPLWLGRYEQVAVWVIDSFWNERIPKALRGTRRIDWIWVTDSNDVPDWKSHFGNRVGVLPWGTDALRINTEYSVASKHIDLLRVGRQPLEYDDDVLTLSDASQLGINFAGRPAFGSDESESQRNLYRALATTKSVLAFSNLVDGSKYTHPTKEYVTGRWLDALASGAAIGGAFPNTETSRSLVPEVGRFDVNALDRSRGLGEVRSWLQSWSEDKASVLRKHAVDHLDWRYRLASIDAHLDLGSRQLKEEIQQLKQLSSRLG
ncbi:hypothetical protein GCM10027027_20010 [Neomicrococcus lactis]